MIRTLHRYRNQLNPKPIFTKESGNTLVVFVMLFPLIFTVFGLAIDLSIASYAQRTLNGAVSSSVQITLSQAKNPVNATSPMLDRSKAYDIVKRMYAANTGRADGKLIPFLMCQDRATGPGTLAKAATSNCGWTELPGGYVFKNDGRFMTLEYEVNEVTKTAFLQFIGKNSLQYNLYGKASTNFAHS